MAKRKDWLAFENKRNRANHDIYTTMLNEAFGHSEVIIGHHLTFGGEDDPDEIPSADTMLFDHDIARKVWGPNYRDILSQLAQTPCGGRDILLRRLWNARGDAQAALSADATAIPMNVI